MGVRKVAEYDPKCFFACGLEIASHGEVNTVAIVMRRVRIPHVSHDMYREQLGHSERNMNLALVTHDICACRAVDNICDRPFQSAQSYCRQ
jgi:hypothetical protein